MGDFVGVMFVSALFAGLIFIGFMSERDYEAKLKRDREEYCSYLRGTYLDKQKICVKTDSIIKQWDK